MGLSPGACEILEPKEEVDLIKHSRRTNSHRSGSKVDKNTGKLPMEHKYSIEDDLNRLFETINLRSSARGFVPSEKNLSRKDSFKRPIRVGVTQASSIGISESVTLKQALRGLCINHASEMAAMKRLSKPTGLLGASEAGAIKRLYRAVVVDVSESGLPLHEGKGSSVEISLGPDKGKLNTTKKVSVSLQVPQAKSASSTSHFSRLAVATTSKVSMDKPPQKDGDDPVQIELTGEASIVKPELKGKLKNVCDTITVKKALEMDEVVPASREVESSTSMPERGQNVNSPHLSSSTTDKEANKSAGNSPLVVKPFSRNRFFLKKKVKDSTSPSDCSSTQCGEVKVESKTKKGAFQREKFNQKKVEKESTSPAHSNANSTMDVCMSNTDFESSKPGFQSLNCDVITVDAEVSEISRSTENGEISQSSKSIVADYSSSTTITEESNIAGPAFSGTRPHMSKDMRWHAIRRVEMQHGSLGLRHFKLLKQLGSGDIGTVYLAELTGTSCLFAVKVMDIEFLACRKKIPRAQTEREILQMLDHPFLPTLFAHFTTDKFSCLAMEYCPGGDLHILRQRQSGRSFSEQAARFYVAEVLLALEYLHMLGVVYRDLKPENILIREDGHIMLTDFDLSLRCTVSPTLLKSSLSIVEPAKKISGPCMESSCIDPLCIQPSWVQVPCFTPKLVSTVAKTRKQKSEAATLVSQLPQLVAEPTNARSNSFVGTHEYLAPEIIKGEGHGNAVDWWTFGIFLYELLYGKTPFKGSGNEDTLANVVLHSLKFPESPQISFQARDLIRGLLVKEPENRLGSVKGATEIRQHPFFEGLNWALIRCTIPPKFPNSCEPVVCLSNSKDSNCMEIQTTGGEQLEFQLF